MRSLSAVIAAAVLVMSTPGSAGAATKTVKDDADDGAPGPALDISAATLDSKQGVLKIRIEVGQVDSGGMLVYLQPKGGAEYRASSDYDANEGTLDNTLYKGNAKVACKGLNAAWNTGKGTVSLRVPATCIEGGDYDKVRFKLLSEKANGSDNDFAPEDNKGYWKWSPYVARG